MKKLAFLLVLVFGTTMLFAQSSKVQSALNYSKPQYNQLDKAQEAIEAAIVHEKTKDVAKTWKVRGQVYQAIAKTEDEKFKALCENPLDVALSSYKKALALDDKGRMINEVKVEFLTLQPMFINKAVEDFGVEKYSDALSCFESSLTIDSLMEPGKQDSVIIFNAGIAADKAGNYDKAIFYYNWAASLGYEGSRIYGFLANIQKTKGDTAAYVETLKVGIEKYPDDIAIIFELINYYLDRDESDEALGYISKAIEKDPTNHTLYFAQGAIYDKKKDFDSAKASYDKAVEIKPDYFNGWYNLGALFFNRGVEMLKEANNIPPNEAKRYDAAVKESFKELEKALPYLEKAHQIDPTEKSTLLTLKEICFKLRNDSDEYMAKFKEYNEKVKALPEE